MLDDLKYVIEDRLNYLLNVNILKLSEGDIREIKILQGILRFLNGEIKIVKEGTIKEYLKEKNLF